MLDRFFCVLHSYMCSFLQFAHIHEFSKLQLEATIPAKFCSYVNGPCTTDSVIVLNDVTYAKMADNGITSAEVRTLSLFLFVPLPLPDGVSILGRRKMPSTCNQPVHFDCVCIFVCAVCVFVCNM